MDNAHNKGKPMTPVNGMPVSKAAYAANQHKQASGVDGVLANLFRSICLETTNQKGISLIQWNKLMADYIRNLPENKSSLDRMSVRGNLNKDFRRQKMTWQVFSKGIIFLKFSCFNFRIDATTDEGQSFSADISVLLSSMDELRKIISQKVIDEFFPTTSKHSPDAVGIHYGNARKRHYCTGNKGVLARLFNLICLEYSSGAGIGQLQWNKLLTSYIERFGAMYAAKDITSIRGNLKKEFRKGSMTWKVLCKGLRFLKVTNFVVTFRGIREDGHEYESSIEVMFNPRNVSSNAL